MKRTLRVDYGETVSVGGYQSIKPGLSDSVEYDTDDIPGGVPEEAFRKQFKNRVRQEYFELKKQMLDDFIGFASQVQKIYVPCKEK